MAATTESEQGRLDRPGAWWGQFDLPVGQPRAWRVGPLHLLLQRTEREWRISFTRNVESTGEELAVDVPAREETLGGAATTQRFGFRKTGRRIHLLPALADRPLVVNPEIPFTLPSGEEVTLFISSPLWFRILLQPGRPALLDEPLQRPSDTWFGPTTMVGELCYAGRTAARLNLANIPQRPERAISAVRIRNRARSQLPLERLNLPLLNLSLFSSGDGHLWTEAITLDRQHEDELAALHLGKGPPAEAHEPHLVSGPRTTPEKGLLVRTFGQHFTRGTDDR